MATKKSRRIAGEKRQAIYEAETRASGLRAQRRDREYRERQAQKAKDAQEKKKRKDASAEAIERMLGPGRIIEAAMKADTRRVFNEALSGEEGWD